MMRQMKHDHVMRKANSKTPQADDLRRFNCKKLAIIDSSLICGFSFDDDAVPAGFLGYIQVFIRKFDNILHRQLL